MSSSFSDSALTDWFRRFDAAARHLPAEDRAAQQEELRQHLDALTAANVALGQSAKAAQENALTRLGDPVQIGRKLNREWQQSRTDFRADIKAIGFGIALGFFQSFAPLFIVCVLAWLYSNGIISQNAATPRIGIFFHYGIGFGGTLLTCFAIGRKYPLQAIKAVFYSNLFWDIVLILNIVVFSAHNKGSLPQSLLSIITQNLLWGLVWSAGRSALAYLASVTRRGWYKPTLSDFKLRLPRRRAVSRG